MQGIIYTRVSSDEQVKGTSLEFQEELCRQYCEHKGMTVVALFREEGETAKDLSLNNRKKFLEALEYCRKNKLNIQAFVVLRVDRFARNTEDHFAVRKILLDYGVTLHSVTEPIGNKPAEKFIETVLAGAAEYDNAIRRQRCTDGMLARIKQGIYPWRPPLGYTSGYFNRRGEKKTEPDPPDERVFPLIQKALKVYATGGYSQVQLAHRLDEWGLGAIRDQKTRPQLVDRLTGQYLKFYAGILVNPWTGEEVRGQHQPMITEEDAYHIQLVRSGKARLMKRDRYNPAFPLRRTVLCATCTTPLTGSAPRGRSRRYFYYHCHHKACPQYGRGIDKQALEQEFIAYLEQITPKEGFLALFQETIVEVWQEKQRHHTREAQHYEKRLAALATRKQRMFAMREDGSYTKAEFLERKAALDNEILAAKIALSETRIDQDDLEAVVAYATTFIRHLGRQWFDIPPQLRARFQQLVFPDGIPYTRGRGFGTARLGLIYDLNRQCAGQKSPLVHLLGIRWNQIVEELKTWQQFQTEVTTLALAG